MANKEKMAYTFVKRLGEGAFGTVGKYETPADHSSAKKHPYVAIKTIKGLTLEAVQEAMLLKELHHINIITYINAFFKDGELHIVMQYADKGTLRDLMKVNTERYGKGKFPEKSAWAVIRQIASAIDYFHNYCEETILHRDLKPENIVAVTYPTGIVLKVADFGIARQLEKFKPEKQYAQTRVGTMTYMSPEALRGDNYEKPSDVWSFGAIISALCNDGEDLFPSPMKVLLWPGGKSSLPSHYSYPLRQTTALMIDPNPKLRPDMEFLLYAGQKVIRALSEK